MSRAVPGVPLRPPPGPDPMLAVTGHSEDPASPDAIAEALGACAGALGDRPPVAGLLFAGVEHDHQALLDAVEARYPGLPVVGCSAYGELSSGGFTEGSVALMLLAGEGLSVGAGLADGVVADPAGAGRRAAQAATAGLTAPPRVAIALVEAFGVDTPALLGAIGEVVGPGVPVVGGLAAEPFEQGPTFQFGDGRAVRDGVAVLVLGGPVRVSTGVGSGWAPMGAEHRVTAVDGLAVTHVDGEPARDVWARYFGAVELADSPRLLAVYPDGEVPSPDGTDYYLSTPFTWREDGGLVVGPPIPEGARFRFSDATRDQMLTGAEASVAQAQAGYAQAGSAGAAPDLALVFSCSGRQMFLGTQVVREAEILRERLGADVPTVGFYTYGEFCPLPGSDAQCAHSSTFVSVLLGDEPLGDEPLGDEPLGDEPLGGAP